MSLAMTDTGARMPSPHDDDDTPLWRKALPVVLVLIVLCAAGYGLSTMMGSGAGGPKKQTVRIAVLPDTPPPPPPKEEKKPEPPKEEPKQIMQSEQAKVVDTPPQQQAEQLKMEGAAGDGPSAFSAGSVGKDYNGQPIGTGAGAPQPTVADRTRFKYYANSARQALRTELDKTLAPELMNLGARLRIWIDDDGTITRFEVAGLTDKAVEDRLRQAMEGAARAYRLAPPAGMPQPLELRLSVNPMSG